MDDAEARRWFVRYALRQNPRVVVFNAYAGDEYDDANGIDGVRKLALEHASEQITTGIENGQEPIAAFNFVTDEWPLKTAAYLAAHEVRERDRDDEYMSEARDFAEIEGVLHDDPEQTVLDCYYDDNLNHAEMSADERRVALILRASNADVAEYMEEIEYPARFIKRLDELNDVDEALRAHHFDSAFDSSIISHAAPPDEWPDDMSPERIESERCIRCNNQHYRIATHNGSVEWVSEAGQINNIYTPEDAVLRRENGSIDGDVVCDECIQSSYYTNNPHDYVVASEAGIHRILLDRSPQLLDDGAYQNNEYDEAPDHAVELVYNIYSDSNEWMTLTPTGQASSPQAAQTGLLEQIYDGTAIELFEEYQMAVEENHSGPVLHVSTNAEDARAAKQMLDNATDV